MSGDYNNVFNNDLSVVLLGKASIPAFFEKLANDYNINVNQKDSFGEVLVNLSDVIRVTIDNYLSNYQYQQTKKADNWLDLAITSLADIAAQREGYRSADHLISMKVKKAADMNKAVQLVNDPEIYQALSSMFSGVQKSSKGGLSDLLDKVTGKGHSSGKSKSKDDDEEDEDED